MSTHAQRRVAEILQGRLVTATMQAANALRTWHAPEPPLRLPFNSMLSPDERRMAEQGACPGEPQLYYNEAGE